MKIKYIEIALKKKHLPFSQLFCIISVLYYYNSGNNKTLKKKNKLFFLIQM